MKQPQLIDHASRPALRPVGLTPAQQIKLARWPQDDVDLWEERAAILEHDGGAERGEAERAAWEEMKDLTGRY